MNLLRAFAIFTLILSFYGCKKQAVSKEYVNISGVYPHLAMYNYEDECGTGAIVPWADKLWVITYGPHLPEGSSDKLYEIDEKMHQKVRPESIGGTPANRMIHRESNQLFIGPYVIGDDGSVQVISYADMAGRHTGNASHLEDPANKIYFGTMEEGFYEVDVHNLAVTTLYKDARTLQNEGNSAMSGQLLPGAHGKGLYSGQGVLVYSNNGESGAAALRQFNVESGSLSEWNGSEWTIIRRNQFTEVTGSGSIYGNSNPEIDPIWATGWDHKSLLVGLRDQGEWTFFRLPKASHTYDGAHGWNTEWPRIRNVGTNGDPEYLMTMHGMFWSFPGVFSAASTGGIRPQSAYLKVIGDFTRWKSKLVMGCDDSARKEFLNTRKVKGGIGGPGQSNSNLWFIEPDATNQFGPSTASGAVWLEERVSKGMLSDPFLFAGWDHRVAWVANHGTESATIELEVDQSGNGNWEFYKKRELNPGAASMVELDIPGEWIRVRVMNNAIVTVHFSYTDKDERAVEEDEMFRGITGVNSAASSTGLLYGLGDNKRALGMSAMYSGKNAGYYELDSLMQLVKKDNPDMKQFIDEQFAIPQNVVKIEESSVLVTDDLGRRWRFPLGDVAFNQPTAEGRLRICREVATERDLLNLHGTFYELPAENADGFAKVRPIASHSLKISDYASYRGMLIMTGIDPENGDDNPHIFTSEDGKAAIWAGVIDDLWKLGKPVGYGGPWKETKVVAGEPSDPYLIGYYDRKSLELLHDSQNKVTFSIEVEPVGHGPWMKYMEVTVGSGETFTYDFPDNFQSRWIRFACDTDCNASALLDYR